MIRSLQSLQIINSSTCHRQWCIFLLPEIFVIMRRRNYFEKQICFSIRWLNMKLEVLMFSCLPKSTMMSSLFLFALWNRKNQLLSFCLALTEYPWGKLLCTATQHRSWSPQITPVARSWCHLPSLVAGTQRNKTRTLQETNHLSWHWALL